MSTVRREAADDRYSTSLRAAELLAVAKIKTVNRDWNFEKSSHCPCRANILLTQNQDRIGNQLSSAFSNDRF